MSLGFSRAGFRIAGSIEKDPFARATHSKNFPHEAALLDAAISSQPLDITAFSPDRFNIAPGDIQIIIGGPPCQAFSRIGRAKLREIMAHPEAHLNDSRANLYTYFLEYVEYFHPLAVLMENVPDIMNFGGKNVAEEIASTLDSLGYRVRYTILNATLYGVPQFRNRLFLLAYRNDLNVVPEFPACTHYIEIPRGYKQPDSVAPNGNQFSLPGIKSSYYMVAPMPHPSLPSAITVRDAISDLGEICSQDIRPGPRVFDTLAPYRTDLPEASQYAQAMRSWPGFTSNQGVYDHVTRFLPRDYRIFSKMEPGDQYPQAVRVAEILFEEALDAYEEQYGHRPESDSSVYQKIKGQYVPPYDPDKFPNKWWKLVPGRPARTLTAHLSRDSYTHIHHDSNQARTISVREAARLQSFPDGFWFSGGMGAAFRQIGNAVPPLMAYALARQIHRQIEPFLNKDKTDFAKAR